MKTKISVLVNIVLAGGLLLALFYVYALFLDLSDYKDAFDELSSLTVEDVKYYPDLDGKIHYYIKATTWHLGSHEISDLDQSDRLSFYFDYSNKHLIRLIDEKKELSDNIITFIVVEFIAFIVLVYRISSRFRKRY